jgi:hypothetical protein
VLLRLTYLAVTNAFGMLRLLPMSDRAKDMESWPCATRSPSSNGNCTERKFSSPRPTEPSLPPCCTDSPAMYYASSDC